MSSFLQSLLKRSLAMVIDRSLNVCNEFVKFSIILFILYRFTIWSFHIWDEILQGDNVSSTITTADTPDILAEFQADVKETAEIINKEIISNAFLANDTSKIENTPIINQLEIEAEFEENQAKLMKSEAEADADAEFENVEHIVPKKEEPNRNDTAESSNPNGATGTHQQNISFDDQIDHESFYRA